MEECITIPETHGAFVSGENIITILTCPFEVLVGSGDRLFSFGVD